MDTDPLFLSEARSLKQEALAEIFDLYASPLYFYARRLCGDPLLADHIVGDVFARLLEQFVAGKGPTSNLRSYLYEMAYHRIIDESRDAHRRLPLEALSFLRAEGHSGRPEFSDPILSDMILHALHYDLTDDQRHVIVLRFVEEFNLRETAAILGKDVSHVKVIQSRGLAKLRKVFEAREIRIAASLPKIEKFPPSARV